MSLCEMIKLFESSVEGLKLLQEHFGSFLITEEMFAIEEGKKCKVWINGKYSENCIERGGNWETNRCRLISIMKNICVFTPLAH